MTISLKKDLHLQSDWLLMKYTIACNLHGTFDGEKNYLSQVEVVANTQQKQETNNSQMKLKLLQLRSSM